MAIFNNYEIKIEQKIKYPETVFAYFDRLSDAKDFIGKALSCFPSSEISIRVVDLDDNTGNEKCEK